MDCVQAELDALDLPSETRRRIERENAFDLLGFT